jgi:UDP-N-acetylmuramoyl-L-alanyl-D-glutamate--2,6-diaminopimelate ligase
MRLADLLARLDVVSVSGDVAVDLLRVTRDSREVDAHTVFVAIRGAQVDGHDLAGSVPAPVVVVERPVATRAVCVQVRDAKLALALLAAALHGDPGRDLAVVGVTGTNGKTTVTTLVDGALRSLGWRTGRIGTTGNAVDGVIRPTAFTTPEAPALQQLLAEMRDEGVRTVAMEVSSIGLAQRRVDGIPFHVAVFTNLTQDHLDFHGDMARYRDAKARLFRDLLRPAGGPPRALLCADDAAWSELGAPADRWTYGLAPEADLRIRSVTPTALGMQVALDTPVGATTIDTALVGAYNAQNVVAAVGVLLTLGVGLDRAARAVGEAPGAPGRLERVQGRPDVLALVDYAHTEDALANVLRAVRAVTRGRLWVVFGCGGDRDPGKRPRMGAIAEQLADEVVVTSDNPRSEDPAAIAAAVTAGMRRGARVVLDRAAAIGWAVAQLRSGDALVVAGKGHETYQQIGGVDHPFDDREVLASALQRSHATNPNLGG